LSIDPHALARELMAAYDGNRPIPVPPSARDPQFDLEAAYAVEAELARLRCESGRRLVGRKVGYANKAVWRVLKLETLVWAHMYDDTVKYSGDGAATFSVSGRHAPKIEPEIVFKLRRPLSPDDREPAGVLAATEWLALGFEIIDCLFPDWMFQPPDFVAAFGLHVALFVGEPRPVTEEAIASLAEQLPRFTVRLMKDGRLVAEGSGRNSLRSPALCVAELAAALARSPAPEPLAAGELVSSGTLTESQPIAAGETWSSAVDGIDLPGLTLRMI
jgi:2-oxo-3-hexenedioate decarboxylase